MTTTRIAELSSLIADNTAKIDAYLASNGASTPSFDATTPSHVLLNSNIAGPRQIVLEATDELHALVLGPVGVLANPSHNFLISLQAIYRFGLATSFPKRKIEATFAEIASGSGLDECYVRRILRHAMTYRIFCEPRKGVVAHTAASKYLAENPLMQQWIGMVSEEMWPAAARTVEAMVKWPGSQEPNHSGFNIAHATDRTVFNEFSKFPEREERYAAAMSWFATGPGLEPSHILNNFAWSDFRNGVVVDVGGSYGSVSIALAQKFPSLRCIVQDQSEIVRIGREKLPPDMIDHVTFLEHDFFAEQPIKDADVYFLRWILHDWADKYAIKVLRALIPALKKGAKILISEIILPEPGTLTPYRERGLRAFDFAMLEFHNAKERDMDDWMQIFKDADSRFTVLGGKHPEGSRLGLIEVVWEGDSRQGQIKEQSC